VTLVPRGRICALTVCKRCALQTSRNILYTLPVALSFSDNSTICYVLLVLWTTSCLHKMEPDDKTEHDIVSSSSPDGGTGN